MIQHHVSRNLVGVSLSCASGIRKQILIWVYNKLQSLLTVVREHQQNADLTRHIHKRAFVEVQVLQKRISSTLLELKKKKNGCIGMSEKKFTSITLPTGGISESDRRLGNISYGGKGEHQ